MNKRPLAVTVIALIYIAVGAIGFAYHLPDFQPSAGFPYSALGVEVVRLLAIVAGVFMLRGCNWARWLAIAWIAFHTVVGALHGPAQAAMHGVFLAVFSWLLTRPNASRFFRR